MAGGFFKRRDAVFAITIGTLIAITLNVWYNVVASREALDGYMWLAHIHEPAGSAAERLAHALYPLVGYPWCVRFALVYGYVLLVCMWVLVMFVGVKIGRLAIAARHEVARRRRPAV